MISHGYVVKNYEKGGEEVNQKMGKKEEIFFSPFVIKIKSIATQLRPTCKKSTRLLE